ncbi:MAG: OsmC family protein [Polaromonas sp.]|nr:OsmC family protein [Polaromonas sp.]MDP3356819.1 OsmC family protein [Polaromonas sp.]MDP3752218.1 OsmC family protein [Polaromonas sp.]
MKNAVYKSQASLRAQYAQTPELAMVTDEARTGGIDPTDPFHSRVEPMRGSGVKVPCGVHRAVGGPYDAPCPGDLLCAALAACQDSSIRMVANLMGIELIALAVQVKATVDVRGAMGIDMNVPVGFQSITCNIHLEAREDTPPEMLEKLLTAAQRCCVVGQTLQHPTPITTHFSAHPLETVAAESAFV